MGYTSGWPPWAWREQFPIQCKVAGTMKGFGLSDLQSIVVIISVRMMIMITIVNIMTIITMMIIMNSMC
jgi:hypothetical protein